MSDRVAIWRWGDAVDPLRSALSSGGLLVVPTESSYGLAVDPRDARGVERIYAVKERDRGQPLPVVAADRSQVEDLGVRLDDPLLEGLSHAWPAPLSLLLPFAGAMPAAADEARLALRIPAHQGLRRLLAELGTPLTATSANPSGAPPLLDPREVELWLADEPDVVLVDDGILPGGEPSTLVGVREGRLEVLRRGAVPVETLEEMVSGRGRNVFSAASVEIFADESR